MSVIKLLHGDCQAGIKLLPDNSVDCILTDPPYLYLKNQKLEREFDELALFTEWRRVLKPTGFVVLFGRGTSFYRWNTILADLGMKFKEEIVWDKLQCASPVQAISRVHETISIFSNKTGAINRVKVPYLEMKGHDISSVVQDVKRMKSILKNTKSLDNVLKYLQNNSLLIEKKRVDKSLTAIQSGTLQQDRCAAVLSGIENGMKEKSIIRADRGYIRDYKGTTARKDLPEGDRCTNVINAINAGMNEKSIIKQTRDHYTAIHPTQKPVRLLQRLLALTTQPGDHVVDCFAGSGSTAVACHGIDRHFTGWEIDAEYFAGAQKRIAQLPASLI